MSVTADSWALMFSYSLGWRCEHLERKERKKYKGQRGWEIDIPCTGCGIQCSHPPCCPSSPWGLIEAGLGSQGLAGMSVGMTQTSLNQTLGGASMESQALERRDFEGSCCLMDCLLGMLWVGLCFGGFAAGQREWVCLWQFWELLWKEMILLLDHFVNLIWSLAVRKLGEGVCFVQCSLRALAGETQV